jgi:hypothetical protein
MSEGKHVSAMWEFLPDNIQDSLKNAVEMHRNKERTAWQVLLGSCPHCGDKNTMDCSLVKDLNDITVGLCNTCGYLWCLECDAPFLTTVDCGHWQVCAGCTEEKDLTGYCGVVPSDCAHIKEWFRKSHPLV